MPTSEKKDIISVSLVFLPIFKMSSLPIHMSTALPVKVTVTVTLIPRVLNCSC